jgi:hypothetical protein
MQTHARIPAALRVSISAAFALGILVPLAETVRRWHQLTDPRYFINWFDDYLIGGLVVWAAWKTCRAPAAGQRFLAAAWGFASGLGFGSFFGQLQEMHRPDPAPVSAEIVMIVKGVILAIALACLALTLKPLPEQRGLGLPRMPPTD